MICLWLPGQERAGPRLVRSIGLVQAGLVFQKGAPPFATYLFKHALVQDMAYGTLLREQRRALHARIVEALKNSFAEIADRQPELFARHCAEAGLLVEASEYHLLAANRATAAMNNKEAVAHLKRGATFLKQEDRHQTHAGNKVLAHFKRPDGCLSNRCTVHVLSAK